MLVDVETSVWCLRRLPVIYVGGWMLDDDGSGMLPWATHSCSSSRIDGKHLLEVHSHLMGWDVTQTKWI